jgi:nucleoside-diphosphate-sugar epimerase
MILIYGGTGFIGKYIILELNKHNLLYKLSSKRIYKYDDVMDDINTYKPTHIISAAGYSTPSNIDYYESNIENLIITNTTGNLILADITKRYNIHLTLIMSGCIYTYTSDDYYNNIYYEDDIPNFYGSTYSANRIATEYFLMYYSNICILRLRMPISNDMSAKSLITKIINYRTVINIPNSMSVLDDVIPFVHIVINKNLVGIYNLVNNGIITHTEILDLYKLYVNPYYKYTIISEEEQNEKLYALRSNCQISNNKVSQYIKIPYVKESVANIFIEMKKVINKYNLF